MRQWFEMYKSWGTITLFGVAFAYAVVPLMSSAYHSAHSSPELGGERLSYYLTPVDETREWNNIGVGGQRPDSKAYRIRKIMAGTIRLLFPILKYYDEAAQPIIDNDLRRRNLEYVNSS